MITGFAITKTNGSTEFGIIKVPDDIESNNVEDYVNKWVYTKEGEILSILTMDEVLNQYDNVAYLTTAE